MARQLVVSGVLCRSGLLPLAVAGAGGLVRTSSRPSTYVDIWGPWPSWRLALLGANGPARPCERGYRLCRYSWRLSLPFNVLVHDLQTRGLR